MEQLTPPWGTLVLVCSGCRGARGGPDARHVRKSLKHAHDKAQLRVLEVDCMKLCPDDAVAVCVVPANAPSRCVLVGSERDLTRLRERI